MAAAGERRAADRKELFNAKPRDVQGGPISVAVPNCEIEILSREIDVLKRCGDPQIDGGMLFSKSPKPVHKPFAGEVR